MASAVDLSRNLKNVLEVLINNIEQLLDKMNDSSSDSTIENSISSFNYDEFWKNFEGATKLISHESTKLCMMFSELPFPTSEECQKLANNLEGALTSLLNSYFAFPKTKGRTLHKELQNYVHFITHAVKDLCVEAKNSSNHQLQSVGSVWEKCKAIDRLPKNNKEAVLSLCEMEHSVVEDAANELLNAIQNDGEDSDEEDTMLHAFMRNGIRIPCPGKWTDADRHWLHPCLALVRAFKICLKKTTAAIYNKGNGNNDTQVAELDNIAEIIKPSSSLVDDFILSLYPPTDYSSVHHQASLLKEKSLCLITAVQQSHINPEDESWVNFMQQAVEHNWQKINDLMPT